MIHSIERAVYHSSQLYNIQPAMVGRDGSQLGGVCGHPGDTLLGVSVSESQGILIEGRTSTFEVGGPESKEVPTPKAECA